MAYLDSFAAAFLVLCFLVGYLMPFYYNTVYGQDHR